MPFRPRSSVRADFTFGGVAVAVERGGRGGLAGVGRLVRGAPARHEVKVVDEQGGHVLLQAPQARDVSEDEHAGYGDVHAEPWPEEGRGGSSTAEDRGCRLFSAGCESTSPVQQSAPLTLAGRP